MLNFHSAGALASAEYRNSPLSHKEITLKVSKPKALGMLRFAVPALAWIWLVFGGTTLAHGQDWRTMLLRADSLVSAQQYDSAKALGLGALVLAEQQFGSNDTVIAKVLYRLGGYCTRLGDNGAAEQYFARCLNIFESALPAGHPHVARTLNALGLSFKYQGKYAEAEPLYRRSLRLKETSTETSRLEVANSLNNLAELCQIQSKYAEAESLYVRALTIRSDTLGADSREAAKTLARLGGLYLKWGRYGQAGRALDEAVGILRAHLAPEDPDLLEAVFQQGNFLYEIGDDRQAEVLQAEAVRFWEQTDDPNLSSGLTALAATLGWQGRHGEAEPLLRKALAVAERHYGPDHPQVAIVATDMALQYAGFRNYSEAEQSCRRAIAIKERTLGSGHMEVGQLLNNLAYIRILQGKYADADSLLQRSMSIAETGKQMGHPQVAHTLESLAELRLAAHRYTEADSLLQVAGVIARNSLGERHPSTAAFLMYRGAVALARGDLTQADTLFSQSLELSRTVLDADHPQLARCLELSSESHRLRGDIRTAAETAEQALGTRQRAFHRNAVVLSEHDALLYCQLSRDAAHAALSCCLEASRSGWRAPSAIPVAIMSSKGAVTEGMIERRRLLMESADSTLQSLWSAYRRNRLTASHCYSTGSGIRPEEFAAQLDSLDQEADSLENELALRSSNLWKPGEAVATGRDDLFASLPDSAVLIDYMRFESATAVWDSTETHYAVAIVSRSGIDTLVDLGSADLINQLVERFRGHMLSVAARGSPTVVDALDFRAISRELFAAVWLPIRNQVPEGSSVIIVPDGALTLVPFATLSDGEHGYLIEHHRLHYANSIRNLKWERATREVGSGLLALGNPDYDAEFVSVVDEPDGRSDASTPVDTHILAKYAGGTRTRSSRLDQLHVQPLPATEREVRLLAEAWQQHSQEPVIVLTGRDASEKSFRQQAIGKRIVHVATHGYYIDQNPGRAKMSLMNDRDDLSLVNPLLTSGLVLAGANRRADQEDPLQDGILSAAEVMFLDLRGVDVAVLSACETGLGTVESGEGVYGLRRAFEVAGVHTVISTLWPIPDSATAGLMGGLYATVGTAVPDRLSYLQVETIRRIRAEGKPEHPFYWGAFIAIGEIK